MKVGNIDFNTKVVAEMPLPLFLERYGSKVENAIEFWKQCHDEHNKENEIIQDVNTITKEFRPELDISASVETKRSSKRNNKA